MRTNQIHDLFGKRAAALQDKVPVQEWQPSVMLLSTFPRNSRCLKKQTLTLFHVDMQETSVDF